MRIADAYLEELMMEASTTRRCWNVCLKGT